MNFFSLSMLRPITKMPLLLLLAPYTLQAMGDATNSMHDQQLIFSNAFEIRAIAKFHSLNVHKKDKDFARYIAPRSLQYDAEGNVHEVDLLNISIQTDDYPPMFKVKLAPLAINLLMQKMKIACTTFNQYNANQSVTIEAIIPLDKEHTIEVPLGLKDETGQLVVLSIETKAQ